MANQTGKNVLVALKAESTFNTAPATVTGATQVRIVSGGLGLRKVAIQSQEIRSDGQTSLGRHGSRMVDGSFQCEQSVGSHDVLYEAVMRSTWVTSVALTNATVAGATLSAITCGTNTVTADGGSWITAGVRVGDVFRITNYSTAANNDINLRVKAVTTSVITIHGTGILTAGSTDTTFAVTIGKKLTRATTPTRRTFYVEQYNQDIDQSEVFGGCRVVSLRINGSPDGMATAEFGLLGASADTLATGASPFYTSPTLATSPPLVFADAKISYRGTDIAVVTAFSLEYVVTARTEPVVGSTVSPDVFDNDARLSGSISFIRQDLTVMDAFTDETEFEVHILLQENETAPKDYLSFYMPACKLGQVTAQLGGDGAMVEQATIMAGMKEGYSSTGYNDTMLTICTSAS